MSLKFFCALSYQWKLGLTNLKIESCFLTLLHEHTLTISVKLQVRKKKIVGKGQTLMDMKFSLAIHCPREVSCALLLWVCDHTTVMCDSIYVSILSPNKGSQITFVTYWMKSFLTLVRTGSTKMVKDARNSMSLSNPGFACEQHGNKERI